MADQDQAAASVQEARDKNHEAEARFKGMADDTAGALSVIGSMPNDLASLADVLDTQLANAGAAKSLAEEAKGHVLEADETLHYGEAENAVDLLDHQLETADGIAGMITEAKEALVLLLARLDEVKLTLEQAHAAADESLISSGSTEENLSQLADRIG